MKLEKKTCLVNDGPNNVFIQDSKSYVFIKCVKYYLCQILKNFTFNVSTVEIKTVE